jgi:hypothetical protein
MRRLMGVACLLALALAVPAAAQQKWVEAAGVARAEPGEGLGGPGRQAALRAALAEAVQQVALELLMLSETAPGKPPPDPAALAEKAARALGGDPTIYVARFQIREDRGVQPRLLLADPDAKAEYQLVVMAQVDVEKVRQRVGARAVAPPGATEGGTATKAPPTAPAEAAEKAEEKPEDGSFSNFELELEQIASYREYAAVREALLGKLGARQALPVEFSRGRAVLSVESPIPAPALAAALGRALEGQVGVEPLPAAQGASEGRLRLRIRAPLTSSTAPSGLTR